MTRKKNFTLRILGAMLVIAMILCIVPNPNVHAATGFDGGWGITNSTVPVYSNAAFSSQIGTIYSAEGFSVLNHYGSYAYVEYSSPSGAKRGYIRWNNASIKDPSCVALVTRNSNLYYGNNTSTYQVSGSVYAGEIVAVLAKNDDWVYVEYNTTSGRKRGYMSYSNLDCYNRPGWFSDLCNYDNKGRDWYVSGTYNVRSGPSTQYPAIGTVSNETVKYFDIETTGGYNEWHYIEYTVNGTSQKKSGFILPQ